MAKRRQTMERAARKRKAKQRARRVAAERASGGEAEQPPAPAAKKSRKA